MRHLGEPWQVAWDVTAAPGVEKLFPGQSEAAPGPCSGVVLQPGPALVAVLIGPAHRHHDDPLMLRGERGTAAAGPGPKRTAGGRRYATVAQRRNGRAGVLRSARGQDARDRPPSASASSH